MGLVFIIKSRLFYGKINVIFQWKSKLFYYKIGIFSNENIGYL